MLHVLLMTIAIAPSPPKACEYIQQRPITVVDTCAYDYTSEQHIGRGRALQQPRESYERHATIIDGWAGSEYVGVHTSELQAFIDVAFEPITRDAWKSISLINESKLRSLELRGSYLCDIPLRLPSLFVLNGTRGMTLRPAANLSLVNETRFVAMVMMDHVTFSAVEGGTYDAVGVPASARGSHGIMAISIVGYPGRNAVRSVRARANNSDSVIGVNQSPHAEVAYSDVGGDATSGALRARCIWTLATSYALVHDNYVHHCSTHSLDFDAYTTSSAAYGNVCEFNNKEGIFVEETASGNFVFNNTVRGNNGNGIALYANAVGPVQGNMIIRNTIIGNRQALSAGGMGHNPKKQSQDNIFASNTVVESGVTNPSHGPARGDYWTDNSFNFSKGSRFPWHLPLPHNSEAVAIFDLRSGSTLHRRQDDLKVPCVVFEQNANNIEAIPWHSRVPTWFWLIYALLLLFAVFGSLASVRLVIVLRRMRGMENHGVQLNS